MSRKSPDGLLIVTTFAFLFYSDSAVFNGRFNPWSTRRFARETAREVEEFRRKRVLRQFNIGPGQVVRWRRGGGMTIRPRLKVRILAWAGKLKSRAEKWDWLLIGGVTVGLILLLVYGFDLHNPLTLAPFGLTRYWVQVGDSGNGVWSDVGHWSASSGGAGGQTVPIAGDAVIFDSLSTDIGDLVIIDQAAPFATLVTTGAPAFTLDCDIYTITHSGAVTIASGTTAIFSSGGTWVANGTLTIGGSFGSNTAWTFDQNAALTVASGGTFNAPNASGSWLCGSDCNFQSGHTFNHNSGTVTIDTNNQTLQQSNVDITFYNINKTAAGANSYLAYVASATLTVTIEGNLTNAGTIQLLGTPGAASISASIVFGTALASSTITNNGAIGWSNTAGHTMTVRAASASFPFTFVGTAPTMDVNGTVTLQSGEITPAITTGATNALTMIAKSMTFVGALTVSSGDTWKSISSTYQGAITATGTFASCNHNLDGSYVYGKAGQIKLSTLNDPQYCPKLNSAIYVLNGELYVDRGSYNETIDLNGAVLVYNLRDAACNEASANGPFFADGLRVIMPKGWSRQGLGIYGGTRKRVVFRCVFGYGFEGETAGANPALGTTLEGAGGGAIDVSASNPETGLNSLDINEPAAATGITSWTSPTFSPTIVRGIFRVSVYTHSSMAVASAIEGVFLILSNGAPGASSIGPEPTFRTTDGGTTFRIQEVQNGAVFVNFDTPLAYVGSTRYDFVIGFDCASDIYSIAINGVVRDADAPFRDPQTVIDRFTAYFDHTNDGRLLFDNIIVCNLDTDTPAKARSGGFIKGTYMPLQLIHGVTA